jgi:hypothetical protein
MDHCYYVEVCKPSDGLVDTGDTAKPWYMIAECRASFGEHGKEEERTFVLICDISPTVPCSFAFVAEV